MSRLLALDYGSKRVGVAVSDNDENIALPRPSIHYQQIDELMVSLSHLCADLKISKIIIGLPLNLAGQDTEQTKNTRQFAEIVKRQLNLTVELEDERFTTKIIQNLRAQETRKKNRQHKEYDSQAAALILQGYMDRINSKH